VVKMGQAGVLLQIMSLRVFLLFYNQNTFIYHLKRCLE
jgi:hypothetical protein